MSPSLKLEILQQIKNNESKVYTNIASSACGYPFKELQLDRTLTNPEVYASRKRVCDLGYLRTAYRKDNGRIGWRCPGEPEGDYVNKGGCRQDTIDRKCLCNGLLATIGLGQVRDKSDQEAPLVTTGQDLSLVLPYLRNSLEYSARDVVSYIVNQARIVGFSVAPAT